jgi:hypothetical protein
MKTSNPYITAGLLNLNLTEIPALTTHMDEEDEALQKVLFDSLANRDDDDDEFQKALSMSIRDDVEDSELLSLMEFLKGEDLKDQYLEDKYFSHFSHLNTPFSPGVYLTELEKALGENLGFDCATIESMKNELLGNIDLTNVIYKGTYEGQKLTTQLVMKKTLTQLEYKLLQLSEVSKTLHDEAKKKVLVQLPYNVQQELNGKDLICIDMSKLDDTSFLYFYKIHYEPQLRGMHKKSNQGGAHKQSTTTEQAKSKSAQQSFIDKMNSKMLNHSTSQAKLSDAGAASKPGQSSQPTETERKLKKQKSEIQKYFPPAPGSANYCEDCNEDWERAGSKCFLCNPNPNPLHPLEKH